MTTDFFPGFAGLSTDAEKGSGFNPASLQKGVGSIDTHDPTDGESGTETPNPLRWSAFAFRVKQFTCSLSREQRADVARRSRFYTMPFLRRADTPDLDDCLP